LCYWGGGAPPQVDERLQLSEATDIFERMVVVGDDRRRLKTMRLNL
jgi:hypothetical protein